MRSTRASAAIARLNARSDGRHFMMALTGTGLIKLCERLDETDKELSVALSIDDFIKFVDAMAPQKILRVTKSEAAFMKQLVKKDVVP